MPPHFIPLRLMPQQANAGPEDDWTGTTDPKARKKMQDRIHQRIRRQRKKAISRSSPVETRCYGPSLSAKHDPRYSFDEHQLSAASLSSGNVIDAARRAEPLSLSSFTACEPDSDRTEWFIIHFSTYAQSEFINGSPRADMLLNLVQFNTTRALVMNARTLGITSEIMLPDARSQLPCHAVDVAATHNSVPLSLKPTYLQLTVSHHPWVDILPLPEIRNNILRRDENSYDKKELCRDLRGFQDAANGLGGMIVWGDAWDPRGWEVTEAFASKWAWVIKDCPRLLESTRHWRSSSITSNRNSKPWITPHQGGDQRNVNQEVVNQVDVNQLNQRSLFLLIPTQYDHDIELVALTRLIKYRSDVPRLRCRVAQLKEGWVYRSGNGCPTVVELLLAEDSVDPDSKSSEYGWTLLWAAAANGNDATAVLLLALPKVDLDTKDNDGRTILL
ncbi:hypothetical protein ACJZ2D_008658 [Fusarium nematophilum]